ncbi:DUF485 domain-containing protein [Azotobacter chroococcum]|jgi:uncharacterized membrane protein (DUF485 family)|uniref:Membrane protein n=2 Tax=Azotobacter chroococcum TaxID=353 RepID=A0A0C4WN33_9GAMM|nr:DUF485 domain-containing protein [Azotobacter chroococcum]AJE20815.1 Membrane protein [Azotobacter chroococcum NCIMB 8003]MEE4463052.1 DUF485 domain-containing protein [Azotobacter chroococcum]NHN77595.1 DUF485 domain-containing protein [Azotobacter chroococcum]TBV91215.1 DUF485 domain-containing protein [Azotobacter chroococcum]TBW10426.1 DUF485 domain-containing protein [Azotobacter chroococcum subsp. isscasi]
MNDDGIYKRIEQNPRFRELVARRERFAWLLSSIMLGLYFAYILIIAFVPQVLGTKLSAESATTLGMPVGVGLILLAFVLTGVYTYRANGEFDRLNQEVLDEVQK